MLNKGKVSHSCVKMQCLIVSGMIILSRVSRAVQYDSRFFISSPTLVFIWLYNCRIITLNPNLSISKIHLLMFKWYHSHSCFEDIQKLVFKDKKYKYSKVSAITISKVKRSLSKHFWVHYCLLFFVDLLLPNYDTHTPRAKE